MIDLPVKKRQEKVRTSPRTLVIYGKPKSGKTKIVSLLNDTLILDMENGGTDHLSEVLTVKVIGLQPPREEADVRDARHKEGNLYLIEVITQLKKIKAETGEFPYKRLVIDTATALEDWTTEFATMKYMQSVQGKSFNRDKDQSILPKNKWESVVTLPQGAGYFWLREAFAEWLKMIHEVAFDIIIICHLKEKLVNKMGKEMSSTDLSLTGKIAQNVAGNSDAIGYVYRKKNKTYINFASTDEVCGSRCDHLRGKEIMVMEEDELGNVIASHWDDIYVD